MSKRSEQQVDPRHIPGVIKIGILLLPIFLTVSCKPGTSPRQRRTVDHTRPSPKEAPGFSPESGVALSAPADAKPAQGGGEDQLLPLVVSLVERQDEMEKKFKNQEKELKEGMLEALTEFNANLQKQMFDMEERLVNQMAGAEDSIEEGPPINLQDDESVEDMSNDGDLHADLIAPPGQQKEKIQPVKDIPKDLAGKEPELELSGPTLDLEDETGQSSAELPRVFNPETEHHEEKASDVPELPIPEISKPTLTSYKKSMKDSLPKELQTRATVGLDPKDPTVKEKIHQPPKFIYTPLGKRFREEARNEFHQLIRDHPGTPEAYQARRNLAEMYKEDGEIKEALRQYTKIVEERGVTDTDPRILIEAGKLMILMGQYPEARSFLEKIYNHPLGADYEVEARMLTAESYTKQNQRERAKEEWEDAARRFDKSRSGREARKRYIKLLFNYEEWREIRHQAKFLLKDPNALEYHPWARIQIARAYIEGNDDLSKARLHLSKVRHRRPNPEIKIIADYLNALTYEKEGNFYQAARLFRKAATDNSQNDDQEKVWEMKLKAAENFMLSGRTHLPAAEEELRSVNEKLEREPYEKRKTLHPVVLLKAARVNRMISYQDDVGTQENISRAHELLDNLQLKYYLSKFELEGRLERAEVELAHERLSHGEKKYQLNSRARAILGDLATRYRDDPLGVRAAIRKAEVEQANGWGKRSRLTRLEASPDTLKEESVEDANELRYAQAVSLLDLGSANRAFNIFQKMSGDPNVDMMLRARAHYRMGVCLELMNEFELAKKKFEEFQEIYKGGLQTAYDAELGSYADTEKEEKKEGEAKEGEAKEGAATAEAAPDTTDGETAKASKTAEKELEDLLGNTKGKIEILDKLIKQLNEVKMKVTALK